MRWHSAAGLLSLSLCLVAFVSYSVAEDAQTTQLEEGQECKPGSHFKIKCNWCFCTNRGRAGCTLIGCIGDFRNPEGEQCKGDSVWRQGCNVCHCVDGTAVCTKKACPGERPQPDPDAECTEGSVWYRDCNRCHCSNGRASCERKQCKASFTRDPEHVCEGESRWKRDCNWCNCAEGRALCTYIGCPWPPPRHLQKLPVDAECTEGSVWYNKCNRCHCTNGVGSCTKKLCRPDFTRDPDQPECEGESRWKKDCNWCNCVDGQGFCTLKSCEPERPRLPPHDPECVDGSLWYDSCNTCHCNNGLAVCTMMGCSPDFRLEPDQPECEENSRWKKDCNWCNCINGKGVCTRRACPPTRGQPRLSGPPLNDSECTDGSIWYKGCNTCQCSNGLIVCTKMACPPGFLRDPELPECEGNSRWKDDCNWCKCANGRGLCTRRACVPGLFRQRQMSTPEPNCWEGSVWYEDCNTCRCANGLKVCTQRDCPPGYTRDPDQPDCKDGSVWKMDCNWCNCNNGQQACTLMGCSVLLPPFLRPPGFPGRRDPDCTEGSVWYKDCNTCHCANGFSVCTMRGCAPDFVRDPDQPECEENSSWRKDCNWCNCVEGKGVCTKRACQSPYDTVILVPDAECTEGSVWYKDCNRCHCTNGVASCTRMRCRPGFTRDPDQPECEGQAHWKKDCNWCNCVNGQGVCTQKGCPRKTPPGTVFLGPPRRPDDDGPVCRGTPEDGRWRKDCNWCSCSEGKAICNMRGCLPGSEDQLRDQPECEGNPQWKKDCNFCRCTNGTASCTRRACRVPAYPTDPNAACTVGSHWRVDCNWCSCANGVPVCTRMTCLSQTHVEEPECKEGSRWRHECNQCMCVDGKSVCTKRLCHPALRPTPDTTELIIETDFCLLPPLQESQIQCTGFFRKWTYRAKEGKCEAIVYGGCGGTKNLFDDLETCEAACSTVGGGSSQKEELPADAECAKGSVWYKECNTCHCTNGRASCTKKRCRPGYTRDPDQPDCEGESLWKRDCNWCHCTDGRAICTYMGCISDIGDIAGRPERCYKAPEAGPCFALVPRFAFVAERNRCEKFTFGGCQGNENNFETAEECHHICGGDQPALEPSCDRSECPWKRYGHYLAKNCTPVYANVSCCPTSFKCPPASSLLQGPADKCVYHGHEYSVGDAVETGNPCSASCHCRPGQGNGRPQVICADIECPDLFQPRKPNCRPIYSIDKCCAVDEECLDLDTPQVAQPRGVTCSWNNQTYKEGDHMHFGGKFACRSCVCTADFTSPNGLGCDDLHCQFELRYVDKMAGGCVPVFFEDRCCPIDWICPDDPKLPEARQSTDFKVPQDVYRCPARSRGEEEPSFGLCAFTCNQDQDCLQGKKCCPTACGGTACVAPVHDDPVESGKVCRIGNLTVPLGERVPLEGDCKTVCSCSTPPEPTCVRYRSCEFADQLNIGCHDIVCQEGCKVRLNATTHCEECYCPEAVRALPRCPSVHCPANCRSTTLKQDPATGCVSCHCDSCPPKDPITGRPPCPMDCDIDVVQDPKTGCEVCKCKDDTRPMGPPTNCPRLPPGGKLPCPQDCPSGTRTVKDSDTHCLRCVCASADGSSSYQSAVVFPDHHHQQQQHCFVDPVTGVPPCPTDCATRWVKDEQGCDICECDPDSPPLYPFH